MRASGAPPGGRDAPRAAPAEGAAGPARFDRVTSVNPPAEPARRPASREGLVEYLIVAAVLALAVAGAVALFGDELRAALGTPPARAPR